MGKLSRFLRGQSRSGLASLLLAGLLVFAADGRAEADPTSALLGRMPAALFTDKTPARMWSAAEQATTQTPTRSWFARNWKWLVPVAAVGAVTAYKVHSKAWFSLS